MNLTSIFLLFKLIGLYFPLRPKLIIFRFHLFLRLLPPPPSLPPASTPQLVASCSAANPYMKFLDIFSSLYGDSIIFFTDGSKTKEPNPVGLLIYSPTLSLSLKFKIFKEALLYTAGALAVVITLKFIKSHRMTNNLIFQTLRFLLADFPR